MYGLLQGPSQVSAKTRNCLKEREIERERERERERVSAKTGKRLIKQGTLTKGRIMQQ
jgi:hypothetical protein